MAGIAHWIQNLAFFMIFSAFVGIILPNEKYKKYINLCLGLILVLMILSPAADWLNQKEIPVNAFFSGLGESAGAASPDQYEEIQRQMIRQSFNAQAESQLAGILAKEGYTLLSVNVETAPDYSRLTSVRITLKRQEAGKPRGFIYVEPIRPGRSQAEDSAEWKKIKKLIADFYNMSTDNIHIEESE
ncbi:MAG: stage III sporulation protein AF [Clostridiales bacterium]|jgi:stage III sporulation protein AF|nr:stage III sporulation protein AF [Clostridiales bacterium]